MKANETMIENYMMWLTDLSILRYKLNKMADQLKALKKRFLFGGTYNNYVAISHQYQKSQQRLKGIERRIFLANNIHLNELHKREELKWMASGNDTDLFENMITANKLILDMQRSIYEGFKEISTVPAKTTTSDLSMVVSLPTTRLLQL